MTNLKRRFRVTHRFHPLFCREYEVLEFRRDWGRDYVAFYDEQDEVVTIPVRWTDLVGEDDAFVVLSGGRAYFRAQDLLGLVDFIQGADR